MPLDTSAAAVNKRNFRFLGITRKHLEERRELNAKLLEEKKRLPRIVNKICSNPTNPDEDCFAMTLELGSPLDSPHIKKKAPVVIDPQLSPIQLELCVKAGKAAEAIQFYQAAFGAEVLSTTTQLKSMDGGDIPLIQEAQLKIYSNLYLISDKEPSPTNSGLSYLLTDDVDLIVDKAVNAGASVSGKLIRVYSECQIWCSVVKLIDPYDNVWIIYSRLCPSCLQIFALFA
ncbi:VOC domain-containing protein [Heracleum sosnowskyi]|uniref:VOC domain-containing protein n=1 Tax=Heracleum sosnowskyi TaxID=360622 RepID=A0AAD8MSV8_9APIA|nr:VOC domain-containing protein [Heracleum sosnowskyi]